MPLCIFVIASFIAPLTQAQDPAVPDIIAEKPTAPAPPTVIAEPVAAPVAAKPAVVKRMRPAPFLSSAAKTKPQTNKPLTESQVVVDSLLNKYWKKSRVNRDASRELYVTSKFANDESVLHAYTLNRMQHNRMKDARAVAETFSNNFPSNTDSWLLKIWLEGLTDNYNQSLIDMRSLKKQICLLYTSPSPRDLSTSRMPSSA